MESFINKFRNQIFKDAFDSVKPINVDKISKMSGLTKEAWAFYKEEYIKLNSLSETEIQQFDDYFSQNNDIISRFPISKNEGNETSSIYLSLSLDNMKLITTNWINIIGVF